MSFNFQYFRSDDFSPSTGGSWGEAITRHNYEEYFLLYVDKELNAAERKAVEVFVQENPDLEEELIMLQQSVLRPDEQLVFSPRKNLLKNTASQGPVNENNYEAYFVAYGDDELTNEEKDLVEQFVYKFPQYQVEFELIQQAKLVPETITFPDKTYLYRTEEDDHKVVPFAWYRIAAAAVVLLVVGGLGLYIASLEKETMVKPVAKTETQQTTEQNPAVTNATNNKEEQQPAVAAINNDQTTVENAVTVKADKKSQTPSNISKLVSVPQEKKQEMKTNEPVPVPDIPNSYAVLTAKPVNVDIPSYKKPAVDVDVKKQTLIDEPANNNIAMTVVMTEETNDSKTYVLNTSVNKTPLRGFFRKVSRVVDKATSFEPSENSQGGVRIANFAVALK